MSLLCRYQHFILRYNKLSYFADTSISYWDLIKCPYFADTSISYWDLIKCPYFADTSISYWDWINCPYFADTTERGDRGVKGGPKTKWEQGCFTDNSNICAAPMNVCAAPMALSMWANN
jgi:hypothetical protein